MSDKMDRGLDEIIADTRSSGPRNRRGGGGGGAGGNRRPRRDDRDNYPRDGVRKSFRNEGPRNLDSEWVHDRYEDSDQRRGPAPRRRRDSPPSESRGVKLRVEEIHYDVTEEELNELFQRIGPISKLVLRYDRAGRSEGIAFVTYERKADAEEAVRQFDGANAYGQPIRVAIIPSGPARNPFDGAIMPGKPLADRIGGRARSHSPGRRYTAEDAARKGIDRYIPGGGVRGGSRSPPRRRGGAGAGGGAGGRRPGARREGGGRDGRRGEGGSTTQGNPRQKKTQEELDADMADYFGGGGEAANGADAAPQVGSGAAAATADDVDMIE